ncbi:MAG: hypothetical protein JWO09_2498 [Bacteroidetes bacterium]|nr:hypothetical protein [Bacteroidota bacterium]
MKNTILYFSLLFSHTLFAQLPNTDIWLLDIKATKDTIILSNPVNITNRAGYDNQPSFSPDGKYILYTSIRDEKQSDIYKYDLKTKQISQFTNTPATSEYSPTFMPDGKNISVVMVEPDSVQRLWKFPLKGGAPSLVMDKVDSIGYHCWIDEKHVALYLITNPFQLVFTDLSTQVSTIIKHDTISRGMALGKVNEQTRFFYSYKNVFYTVDLRNQQSFPFCVKNFNSEDFCFLNNKLISSVNAEIIENQQHFADDYKSEWSVMANLSQYGIKNITRIAISPDGTKMAIVAE